MSLRVISGTAKGHILRSVKGDLTRPITDRVKEALFDIIGTDVVDSTWWDVFAGTGAVGIEALSRGASFVRFTDLHRAPIETIKSNLAATHLGSQADVRLADALRMLAATADRSFDYLYIAPPQYRDLWSKSLGALDGNIGWLGPDAWVVIQIAPKEYQELPLENLYEFDQRRYGTTLLVFFTRKG